MTRDKIEELCAALVAAEHTVKAALINVHDAEQRQIIGEQIEENRGLRTDVLLMQKANAEQREEIRLLSEQVNAANQELLRRAEDYKQARKTGNYWKMELVEANKEITRLREQGQTFAAAFLDRMHKYGQWEDGSFYYNRTCASELQELIDMAKALTQEPT